MTHETVIWDDDTGTWGEASAVVSASYPVQIIGNAFYVVDSGVDFTGTPVPVVVSRDGLTIYGRDQAGNPKVDPGIIKNVQGIWPEISAVPGTVINVYVGSQEVTGAPVQWQGPRQFVVGTDFFLDFIVSGRYIAVRFESMGQPVWALSGYDLDIVSVGGR